MNKISSSFKAFKHFKHFMLMIVFLHIALFCMRILFYVLEKITPKKSDNLLFFLTEKHYYDNSKYMFEFILEKKEFNSFLFVVDKNLYEVLKAKFPNKVVYALSFKALVLFLRSPIVLISYGISSAAFKPYYLHEKCKKIVYLGHGTPMKKMGLQTSVWRKYGKSFQIQKYSYMLGSSPLEQILHAAGFNIDMDNVWSTGLPRNDYLLKDTIPNSSLPEKYPFLNKKILLYAPTWREEGHKTRFFPFDDFNIDLLNEFLEKEDAYILIRGHKEDLKRNTISGKRDFLSSSRIISAEQDKFPDIYQLLPFVDILVSDYSSLMIDFLLLDRPMCFIPYDLKEYESYKGFFLPYEENTPGYKVFTQEDFIDKLGVYLNSTDTHSQWRSRVRNMYHQYQDSDSCLRVFNKLLNIK